MKTSLALSSWNRYRNDGDETMQNIQSKIKKQDVQPSGMQSAKDINIFTSVIEGKGKFKLLRILVFAGLIAGIALFSLNFKTLIKLTSAEMLFPDAVETKYEAIEKSLSLLTQNYEKTMNTREFSRNTARDILSLNRKPFEQAEEKRTINTSLSKTFLAPVIEEEPMPIITIKAILTANDTALAVMDIGGLGQAIILRTGDIFLEHGKILKIENNNVVIKWKKQKIEMSPGLIGQILKQ